ncbi:hypothetical protein FV242_26690 [Methylobacterium sp. WL64]|uniref:hypothetical protein n=1 Tax=Methylobacterium sp. WL64 TaxID=2603894 RepID=UPI0011C71674|nr:hypothetical protein [Methylobacterium sp. WL64]TXM99097.1 hypothetical protein FV242_26690 [Methylobacterium sp. WL64]
MLRESSVDRSAWPAQSREVLVLAAVPMNSDPRLTVILSEISGHPCGASLYAYDGGILIAPENGSPARMMTLSQVVETAAFLLSVWTGMAGEGSEVEFFDPDYTGSIRFEVLLHDENLSIKICEFEPHNELTI